MAGGGTNRELKAKTERRSGPIISISVLAMKCDMGMESGVRRVKITRRALSDMPIVQLPIHKFAEDHRRSGMKEGSPLF